MTEPEKNELYSCISSCLRHGLDGVMVEDDRNVLSFEYGPDFYGQCKFRELDHLVPVDAIRPLLRPMSDITESEIKCIQSITGHSEPFAINSNHYSVPIPVARMVLDYLDSRLLDHRDLIGIGLARPVRYRHYFR